MENNMRKSGYTEDNNISLVRQVAIDILEDLAEMLVDEGRVEDENIFDCDTSNERLGTNLWFDCEDMIVEYIEDLLIELKETKSLSITHRV